MHPKLIEQIEFFKQVKIPLHNRISIQECALSHLNLTDMGKLRDRLEGQSYYNKLEKDLIIELAFESIVYKSKFDWEKRKSKLYKRREYLIKDHKIVLIPFSGSLLPKVNICPTENYIFFYKYNDYKVLLSGLAKPHVLMQHNSQMPNNFYLVNNFSNFPRFNNLKELLSLFSS